MSGRNEAGAFLGKGWKFPPKVNEATGRMEVVREEEDIAEDGTGDYRCHHCLGAKSH